MAGPGGTMSPGEELRLETLRKRADSLAVEQVDGVDEQRTGVLLFALGDETYGVRIEDVREIENEYTVTPIPRAPDFVLGVINIRGEIVSVVDLRLMADLGKSQRAGGGEHQPVIVVKDQTVCTALMVDSIGDIVDVSADEMEPPLATTDRAQADFISGTFYTGGQLVALVNLARVLTPVVSG